MVLIVQLIGIYVGTTDIFHQYAVKNCVGGCLNSTVFAAQEKCTYIISTEEWREKDKAVCGGGGGLPHHIFSNTTPERPPPLPPPSPPPYPPPPKPPPP